METAVYSVTKKPSWGLPDVGVKGIMFETIGESDQRRKKQSTKKIDRSNEGGRKRDWARRMDVVCVWSAAAMSGVERRAESVSWLPRAPGSERQDD